MICQFKLLCWRVRYILGEFHAIRQIAIMQLAVFYELIVCCISHFELCHFTDLKHCISAAIVTKNERQNQITTVDGRNSAPVHRWFIHVYPIIQRILYIPDGAGFLNHQQYEIVKACVD